MGDVVQLFPTALGKSLARYSYEDVERMTRCGMSYDDIHQLAIQEAYAEMDAAWEQQKFEIACERELAGVNL